MSYDILKKTKTREKAIKRYYKNAYTQEWIDVRNEATIARKDFISALYSRRKRIFLDHAFYTNTTIDKNELSKKISNDISILTDTMISVWSGWTARQYRQLKNLTNGQDLHDNMTKFELRMLIIAENEAKRLIDLENPSKFDDFLSIVIRSGNFAKSQGEIFKKIYGKYPVTNIIKNGYDELNF